jgi:hypothetical protein
MSAADTETALAATPLYVARPSVQIDGQASALIDLNLQQLSVSEAEGGLAHLSLTLNNWGDIEGQVGLLFDAGGAVKLGSRISVAVGDITAPQALFDGVVHALEARCQSGGAPELLLLAEDGLFSLRAKRQSRVFEALKPADVAEQIAGEHGLTLDAGDLRTPAGTWAQFNESDLAFLRRLAARLDFDLHLQDRTLTLRRVSDLDRGAVALTLHSQLLQVRVTADLAQQVTAVTASGFDVRQGSNFHTSSSGTPLTTGGEAGATLLEHALGARSEHLAALSCDSEREAQALCDAAFDQRARRFVRVHGMSEGNGAIRVGTRLKLDGLGNRFSGEYQTVETRHAYDLSQGYRTHFVATSAVLAAA